MAWFRRGKADDLDPHYLLTQAHAQAPQPSAQPWVGGAGFRLAVQDIFTIAGRGTVVTGRVESGSIAKGATVRLTRGDGSTRDVAVTGIEMFRKILDVANAGDNVGLLLRGLGRDDIAAGDVLSASGPG